MANRFSRRILLHLADRRYQPRAVKQLATELGIDEDDFDEFEDSVEQLADAGDIVLGEANAVALPPPGREVTGVLRLHPKGFGFVQPDSPLAHGDLFCPPGQTGKAMSGDRVRARVSHEPRRGRGGSDKSPYTARVIEVIQRAEHRYVGNLVKRGSKWMVIVDGKHLTDPVRIRDPYAKNAQEGDKVVIELSKYPDRMHAAEGVITEVLGEHGEPDVETTAVMRAYSLVEAFPDEVNEQARRISQQFDASKASDREDLTDQFILTIDPPDARDFDDAISLENLDGEDGDAAWELGVHIADVAAFVTEGSALDGEAYSRGNSTYLPRKVIPMLPELLSNGICSLQEGVERFTKSCFIKYDARGKVLGARFSRSVIKSNRRLTYLEAQALIDDDIKEATRHCKTEPKYPKELIVKLKMMDELAHVIRKRRLRQGMIVLGLPDAELVFDEAGRVIDAVPEDDAFTHTLIEMFMVEANEAAARLFSDINVPMIRRIHPDPPLQDMSALRSFARVAGYNIPSNPSRDELQQLLDAVRGKPAQQAVHFAVLQTLSKAEYAPLLIGHFALASEHYTHFTSPIRRYPDLIVHRAIDAYIDAAGNKKGKKRKQAVRSTLEKDKRLPDENSLVEMGKHCSATERNSEAAERDLREYLLLELMAEMVGEDFDGTVTGITNDGVFVQLDKYLVDGFLRTSDLNLSPQSRGERWKLNRQTGALVAQRSGKTIQIGDRMTVRIANVEPWRRQMDLALIKMGRTLGDHSDSAADAGSDQEKPADQKQPPKRKPRRQGKGAAKAHQKEMRLKQLKNRTQKGGRKGKGRRRKR